MCFWSPGYHLMPCVWQGVFTLVSGNTNTIVSPVHAPPNFWPISFQCFFLQPWGIFSHHAKIHIQPKTVRNPLKISPRVCLYSVASVVSDSSVPGIFPARILGSSKPRDQIQVSCASCLERVLYHWAFLDILANRVLSTCLSKLRFLFQLSITPRLCFDIYCFLEPANWQETGTTIGFTSFFPFSQGLSHHTACHSMTENHCFKYFVWFFLVV